MAWFKVDDGLHSSRKVLSIPRSIRLQSIGLWALAGSWAAKELTDGHVPDYVVTELGGTPKMVDALVRSGLWARVPDGVNFHDWTAYQPTREQVMEQRSKDAERKREARGRGAESRRSPRGQTAESDLPVPSRPDPIDQDLSASSRLPHPPSYPQDRRTSDQPEVDLGKVKLAVEKNCGRLCEDTTAFRVIGTVLSRAKVSPKNPTAFVVRAIEQDPFEFQQLIDEGIAS